MDNPKYQIIVKTKDGTVLGEITTWLNLKFGDRLNDYGTCTFDVPSSSRDLVNLISLRRFECYILRDGKTVWSGEQAMRKVRFQANDAQLVTITCYTLIEMLRSRLTQASVRFNQIDQAQILKSLVDTSQGQTNGDFGFTFATLPTTMDRDREYALDNIFDSFVNMSNVINGIDFWCDHNKVIHIEARRGHDRSNEYSFELGVNMLQPGITDDFSSPVNKAWALGAGIPPDQLTEFYVDTNARATYLLRENKISQIDVSEAQTLIDKAHDLTNSHKEQVRTIDFKQIPKTNPVVGVLDTGDSVKILIHKDAYSINKAFRIAGYDAVIDKTGEEYIGWIVVGS